MRLIAASFAVVTAVLPAQDSEARPGAVLDPTGVLAFERDGVRYRLGFLELAWPAPGEHRLGTNGLEFGHVVADRLESLGGVLEVRAFGPGGVDLTVRPTGREPITLATAVELGRVEPAVVRGAPAEWLFPAPAPADDPGDLVFCAIGSAGTGLPGQRRIADSIAELVADAGLDFVVLLGDQFAPDGIASVDDPKWASRFDDVYGAARMAMPFFLTLGDAEHRGDLAALSGRVLLSSRLVLPAPSYSFERETYGTRVGLFALDSRTIAGSVRSPATRRARSTLAQALQASESGWRVAVGHDAMYTHADGADNARSAALRAAVEPWFEQHDVDVYIAGGVRALELLEPKRGVLHVASGGGGGPEVAESIAWEEDTLFAATGGGSVWLRLKPELLEITFRGVDGTTLHVHRVEKPR